MKRIALYLTLLLSLAALTVSCGDDVLESDAPTQPEQPDPQPEAGELTLQLNCLVPEGIKSGILKDLQVEVKNVNSGKVYRFTPEADGMNCTVALKKGLYDVTVKAWMMYGMDGRQMKSKVTGFIQAVTLTATDTEVEIPLFFANVEAGLVFSEIFCAGSATPQGSYFAADKYFRIYNNSDQVIYADSFAIAESEFLTVSKSDYKPDIMSEAMAVNAIYMIPGDGHTYPLQPGESLLLCDNAIDHRIANPNSFDMTKADFEWADESTNPNITDVNNPDVPDLVKVYSSTWTVWSPHTQGFKSYALAKIKTDLETYLTDYTYDFEYTIIGQTGQADMSGSCYKLPNDWIADAVNLSVEALFQWIITDPSIDRGWTYCGTVGWDESRLGKCVRRKVLERTPAGIAVLKDTNNSTEDFDAAQPADPFYKY